MIKTLKANIIPILLIAVSIIFINDISNSKNSQAVGLVFPRIIVILLLAFSVLLIARTIFIDAKKPESEKPSEVKMHWPILILFVLYIALLKVFGFFICTPIFIFICNRLFKINTWQSILTSILLVAAIYLLFIKVLFVPLPSGIWIFREINRFIIY